MMEMMEKHRKKRQKQNIAVFRFFVMHVQILFLFTFVLLSGAKFFLLSAVSKIDVISITAVLLLLLFWVRAQRYMMNFDIHDEFYLTMTNDKATNCT